MITYKALQTDRRQFLALTGLTLSEFQRLLIAFPQAYQQLYPANHTAEGQPRQRSVGGGCKGRLEQPEDKLLFLLVYLKTYPLQAVMGELFDLSTPQVNYGFIGCCRSCARPWTTWESSPSGTPGTLPRPKALPGKRLD